MLSCLTWCRILTSLTTIAVATLAVGCDGGEELDTQEIDQGGTGVFVDLGFADPDAAANDQPLRSYCPPGERRCLFENSPLFEQCSADGRLFENDACPQGQMCRAGRCVDFACVPGRPICIGTRTRATCAEDGRTYRQASPCAGQGDICRAGECIDACESAAEARSYIGCEYLAQELPNIYRLGGAIDEDAPFAVVVANPDGLLDTTVSITTADGSPAEILESVTIEPIQYDANSRKTVYSEILTPHGEATPIATPARDVKVPPQAAAVFLLDAGSPAKLRSYRVRSTRPIVAYQFSPYCCNFTATNDASLLLPVPTLGQRYRVLSYPTMTGEGFLYRATATIVAHEDDTTVDIDSPVALVQDRDDFPRSALDTDSFTLQAGESMHLGADSRVDGQQVRDHDLSGMVVTSDKKVAVFGGHECTFVPQDKWACDHLEQQMLPTSTLGRRYILSPVRQRGRYRHDQAVYWRLLADEDSTVAFSPPLSELDTLPPSNQSSADCVEAIEDGQLELEAGQLCEFGTLEAVAVDSSGALIVGGVISGHNSTGQLYFGSQAGDPSFFLLPPVEQFRTSYSFVSPPTFARTYVAVAIPQGAAVALDGVSIDADSRLGLDQVTLAGRAWDIYNIAIEAGFHTIESAERFGIVAYAYDDYVSYAFTGGLDLLPKGSR